MVYFNEDQEKKKPQNHAQLKFVKETDFVEKPQVPEPEIKTRDEAIVHSQNGIGLIQAALIIETQKKNGAMAESISKSFATLVNNMAEFSLSWIDLGEQYPRMMGNIDKLFQKLIQMPGADSKVCTDKAVTLEKLEKDMLLTVDQIYGADQRKDNKAVLEYATFLEKQEKTAGLLGINWMDLSHDVITRLQESQIVVARADDFASKPLAVEAIPHIIKEALFASQMAVKAKDVRGLEVAKEIVEIKLNQAKALDVTWHDLSDETYQMYLCLDIIFEENLPSYLGNVLDRRPKETGKTDKEITFLIRTKYVCGLTQINKESGACVLNPEWMNISAEEALRIVETDILSVWGVVITSRENLETLKSMLSMLILVKEVAKVREIYMGALSQAVQEMLIQMLQIFKEKIPEMYNKTGFGRDDD